MDLIIKIDQSEADALKDVSSVFEEEGGFWFSVVKKRPQKTKINDSIYIWVNGSIVGKGLINQTKEIGQEIISGYYGVSWLWRREGQWILNYIQLKWYKKNLPCGLPKRARIWYYMTPFRRWRIFRGGNEPESERLTRKEDISS